MRRAGLDWGRARHAVAATASALVLAACSLALDADAPQCSTTADCVGRGAAFAEAICVDSRCAAKPPVTTLSSVEAGAPDASDDPSDPFRCVGHVIWPAATSEPLIDHEVFSHFLSGRGVPGLAIDVCARADIECASPLTTVTTDAAGAVAIPITKGFVGYLQLTTAPASFPGLMPTIVPYVFPPGTDPAAPSQLCPSCGSAGAPMVVSKGDLAALAASVSATIDPTRGLLFGSMLDCDNRPQAGIQFELETADEKATRYYVDDGLPSLTRTESSATGEAGFVNVRPGIVAVKARLARTGKVIGARNVLVRAGTFTIFSLPPTPL